MAWQLPRGIRIHCRIWWVTMAELDELLKEFPLGVRKIVEPVYAGLPADRQRQLSEMLKALPARDVKGVRALLSLVMDQYRPLAGRKERISIVGPVNTGKSSLYNQFIRTGQEQAVVGPVPGTTRTNQVGDAGLFSVVDTPGADAYGPTGKSERLTAFGAARDADLLIMVFDAAKGIAGPDRQLHDDLAALGKPYVIVLNKIDLIAAKDRAAVTARVAQNLGLTPDQVMTISALNGENVGQVLLAAAKAEPQLLLAIGQALPAFRYQLAWPRVLQAAAAAGTVALMPLPVASFVPLITIQIGLVLNIAGIYGYPVTVQRAKELLAAFGAGFGARMLFQQLSEVVPVAGWVLSSAVAASTTAAMGYAAIQWFDKGQKVSAESMRALARQWTSGVVAALGSLGQRRPGKDTFRQRLQTALEEVTKGAGR
jgi:small GTP-binding protein